MTGTLAVPHGAIQEGSGRNVPIRIMLEYAKKLADERIMELLGTPGHRRIRDN